MKQTEKCPLCGEVVKTGIDHDCTAESDTSTEPEPPREETLRSSDVVAELEAVLRIILQAEGAHKSGWKHTTRDRIRDAKFKLLKIIATERGRSPTDPSSATRELKL